MESGERRSQRDYTLAFKLSVVDQVEKGEMTYKPKLSIGIFLPVTHDRSDASSGRLRLGPKGHQTTVVVAER